LDVNLVRLHDWIGLGLFRVLVGAMKSGFTQKVMHCLAVRACRQAMTSVQQSLG